MIEAVQMWLTGMFASIVSLVGSDDGYASSSILEERLRDIVCVDFMRLWHGAMRRLDISFRHGCDSCLSKKL